MLDSENKAIVEEVLEDFAAISAIPRPSTHEKAISDYLCGVFRGLGCDVRQDGANNVIADRAASPGFENAPRVILQAHMDMVCAAAEGVKFDPLQDAIRLRREGDILTAEGTSLGADDGAGVAMILYVFRHAKEIGPLRAIITTDEESGMTGAKALDPSCFSDAEYLINWDSENYDELIKGSAGSVGIDFCRKADWHTPPAGQAWRISVRGLLGGHSGERIGDGRGNALCILAQTLYALELADISFAVASMMGGDARNAIPSSAEAVIVTQTEPSEILRAISKLEQRERTALGEIDPALTINLVETEMPVRVLSGEGATAIRDALILLHTGVFQMTPMMPGLVETSSNLGLLRTEEGSIWFSYFPRSSIDEKLKEIVDMCRILGARLGLEVRVSEPSPGWRERPQSTLTDTMAAVFEKQNGRPMKIGIIHAGLECGWHIQKAPNLDMVSVGVTTHGIHSPKERLEIATIAPQVRMVMETLRRIAQST